MIKLTVVTAGQTWTWDTFGPIKIMAVADGYAMVRRPHCAPFVVSLKKLISEQKRITVDRIIEIAE